MNLILVRARAGVRVPMAGLSRRYIDGGDIVPVEDGPYYRKQIADGDLELVDPSVSAPTEPTSEPESPS